MPIIITPLIDWANIYLAKFLYPLIAIAITILFSFLGKDLILWILERTERRRWEKFVFFIIFIALLPFLVHYSTDYIYNIKEKWIKASIILALFFLEYLLFLRELSKRSSHREMRMQLKSLKI